MECFDVITQPVLMLGGVQRDRQGSCNRNYVRFCIQTTCSCSSDIIVHKHTLGASRNVVSCSALLKHWGQQGAGGQRFADLPSTLEPPHRTCTRMPFAFMLYTQI